MMGAVQPYFILAVLFSLHCLDCEANLQGLTCVNDLINNVTCTLNSSSVDPGLDCIIFGYKKIRIRTNGVTHAILISQSCKVRERRNLPPGCSFLFENVKFTLFEVMPNISMECNGALVKNLKDYKLQNHIKMHPPGLPNVSHTDNDTVIYWGPGSPCSVLLRKFEYEVQIQRSDPTTKEVHTFPTNKPQLRIAAGQLKGKHQVRVKVKPAHRENSQWSEWSPSVSWVGPEAANQEWSLDLTFVILAVLISLCVMIVMILVFYRCNISKRFLKAKPVPNPTKYFQSLHSGNLKKWLNPNCTAATLDNAQPLNHISPVEVCESWDAGPSTFNPSSSNCFPQPPINIETLAGSDENRLVDNLSASSSCFSNLGYFVSTSCSSSFQTEPNPVYFAHKDDVHIPHKAHNANLHLSLHRCPTLAKSPSCESLKRGTQSPDSGFCFGQGDVEVKEDKQGVNGEKDQISGLCSSSQLSLTLRLPVQTGNPSTPPGLSQLSSDRTQTHAPLLAANVSAAGWPVACTMYRPSSMPVESCKSGYFILQEIQTTFSNASI
ncbi:interleukin-2 receptor subunit beta isoform X1 [Phyllopteryx taeniolatus]|uniref:interleukin-2 receptor subunit beta isoform X1 n=2 Tax=Phyllopteryx taeniolatus TaxID=161469 RepID=UPI002AD44C56|nr:interleukin-2 receptor subunit beta isoform X1 [Phyllopteryx taeniolatus]